MKLVSSLALVLLASLAAAQTIQPPFDDDYSFIDLGAVPGLPAPAGGLTFLPGDPDTILIGGAANTISADIFSIGVTRGLDGHIDGFDGTAAFFANANGPGGGIDGGLSFGPGGVLFFTSYSDNQLGQLEPGSTTPDRLVALTPLGVASSVGALAFVPAGFPGAGRCKIAQYNGNGNWYDVVLTPDGAGTFDVAATFIRAIGFGPEGIIYVAAGNPEIAAPSILVSEYSGGSVSTYEIDSNGDPVVATRRVFMSGLGGAEGAVIDPETGDFLFSTFGGGNRVIVVRGFLPPPTTTSTSTIPTTTSTSTSSSSSTIASTSSSTTTSSSSTTSTVPTGDCATVPVGPTFESIACRLAALRGQTAGEPALGAIADKLLGALDRAIERHDAAAAECAGGDAKHARAKLKKVIRQLIQYSHRLRTKASRKKIAPEVREPLAEAADAIQEDARTLKASLDCTTS